MLPSRRTQFIYVLVLFLIFLPIQLSPVASMTIDNSQIFLDRLYANIAPSHIQMDYYIKKYAKQENVPLNIAYNIARLETGYKGPAMSKYTPSLTSSANAEGAMQILLTTGREISGNPNLTREDLRHNVELNVKISMKMMRILYKRYGSWAIAAGYYNTGYPKINDYAINAVK